MTLPPKKRQKLNEIEYTFLPPHISLPSEAHGIPLDFVQRNPQEGLLDGISWRFGRWIGEYTIGEISARGTKVWLRPPYTTTFRVDLISDFECREIYAQLLHGESSEFIEDMCNMRGECLERMICAIDNTVYDPNTYHNDDICIHHDGSLQELVTYDNDVYKGCELFVDYVHQLKVDDVKILYDAYPANSIWLLHEKDKVVKELKEVLRVCNENNITWIWV